MKYLKLFENFRRGSKYVLDGHEEEFDRVYKDKHYSEYEFNEILDILLNDCSEFLNELSEKNQYPLFRGASNMDDVIEGMWEKTSRSDRFARDSSEEFSSDFDDVFEKVHGVRLRTSGVFTTKSPFVADSYAGSFYIFFPLNGYQYYHNNEAVDLFALQPSYYSSDEERGPDIGDKIKHWVDGYELNSIEKAELCEITFICNKYYLVDLAFYRNICNHLGLEMHTKNP